MNDPMGRKALRVFRLYYRHRRLSCDNHLFPYNRLDHLHGNKYDDAEAQDDFYVCERGLDDPKGIAYGRDLNEYHGQYNLR